MNTSVIDQPLSPGIISIDMAGQVFAHELRPPPLSPVDNAVVLDLAPPLHNPGVTIDGVSKIYDRSGYGNHGTIAGATWKVLPSGLPSLSFDNNDDYLGCGVFADSENEFWVSLWFILDSTPSNAYLFVKDDTERVFAYFDVTPVIRFRTFGYGDNFNTAGGSVTEGVWHNLVAKLSSTAGSEMWVDTVSVVTDAGNKLSPDGGIVYFGNSSNIGTNGFGGRIALQQVFTTALSNATRLDMYNRKRHLFGV